MTLQDVVDLARLPLEDADKETWTDLVLLLYARSALQLLRDRRADLFFGQYESEPDLAALALGDDFPLEGAYLQPVADYVTARASSHDEEHVVSQRAPQFFNLFQGGSM